LKEINANNQLSSTGHESLTMKRIWSTYHYPYSSMSTQPCDRFFECSPSTPVAVLEVQSLRFLLLPSGVSSNWCEVWAKLLCTRKDKNDIYNSTNIVSVIYVSSMSCNSPLRKLVKLQATSTTLLVTLLCYYNCLLFKIPCIQSCNTLIWTYDNHNTGPSSLEDYAVVLVPYFW